MQLRYSFRLYPSAGQRMALARAFGCARVVFNDALRARETARREAAVPESGELSKQLSPRRRRPPNGPGSARSRRSCSSSRFATWTPRTGTSSTASRASARGWARPGSSRRKDTRQSVRFTANARWTITTGGKLRLPKIGDVQVKWSRTLPSTPSTVTVVKDSAGRYFASFVVETDPEDVLPGPHPRSASTWGSGTSRSSPTGRRSTAPASCAGPRST